jgi:hypothetical protein
MLCSFASDWSSDVCSSDLGEFRQGFTDSLGHIHGAGAAEADDGGAGAPLHFHRERCVVRDIFCLFRGHDR